MVTGSLVDDTVFSITQGAGEPDDIPGPRACNFRFYGMAFHVINDLVILSGSTDPASIGDPVLPTGRVQKDSKKSDPLPGSAAGNRFQNRV